MKKFVKMSLISLVVSLAFSCSPGLTDDTKNQDASQNNNVSKKDCLKNDPTSALPDSDLQKVIAASGEMPSNINVAYAEDHALTAPDSRSLKSLQAARAASLTRAPAAKQLYIPRRIQETSYWCGPAAAQMVQYYFNQPASQAWIASYCGTNSYEGTYVYKIVQWFNDAPMTGYMYLPSWWIWEAKQVWSTADFLAKVKWSVGDCSAPQIWHLMTYPSGAYHLPGYTFNSGHYVCGSGYDGEWVMEDDPWWGVEGENVWITAETAYNCIAANAHYIIY